MNTTKFLKNNNLKRWTCLSPWVFVIFTVVTTVTFSDDSGIRPGPSPDPEIDFPNIGVFRPYSNPVCANHMERSDVETINDAHGTAWHFYTCSFTNNGWCSLNTGHCPAQICHPFTDWIGPWNDEVGRDQPEIVWHYTCVSIGTPYPFGN